MILKNKVYKNIFSLYGVTVARIVFPIFLLPYLTRVLSTDAYGVVTYEKNFIAFIVMIIEFAFGISGTKAIALAKDDKSKIAREARDIILAKTLLSIVATLIQVILTFLIPILREYVLYTMLMFLNALLNIFSFEYVFNGLEKMEIIARRFISVKFITTILTFLVVKSDADILLIPIFDIVSSIFSIALFLYELKKSGIKLFVFDFSLRRSINKIKESTTYFISNASNVVFTSINIILIGIYLPKSDIAYWNLCVQITGTIQSMYTPIIDALYPTMVKTKNLSYIKKATYFVMPIIMIGCVFTYFVAEKALVVIGGPQYAAASTTLRLLIPVMFFGFPSMLYCWPTLGVINKQKQATATLVIATVFQIVLIMVFIIFNHYTLIEVAISRTAAEVALSLMRIILLFKYRKEFENV